MPRPRLYPPRVVHVATATDGGQAVRKTRTRRRTGRGTLQRQRNSPHGTRDTGHDGAKSRGKSRIIHIIRYYLTACRAGLFRGANGAPYTSPRKISVRRTRTRPPQGVRRARQPPPVSPSSRPRGYRVPPSSCRGVYPVKLSPRPIYARIRPRIAPRQPLPPSIYPPPKYPLKRAKKPLKPRRRERGISCPYMPRVRRPVPYRGIECRPV